MKIRLATLLCGVALGVGLLAPQSVLAEGSETEDSDTPLLDTYTVDSGANDNHGSSGKTGRNKGCGCIAPVAPIGVLPAAVLVGTFVITLAAVRREDD